MPTHPREFEVNGVYHVIKRGVEKRATEHEPLVDVLAFTLMPNHFHMVLREIREGGISQYMQKIGGYSTYFNKQYDRVGPLFQSRFKAAHIKNDIQLNNVFVYVHANPIGLWEPGWKDFKVENPGGAIKKLEEYWASSYNDYIGSPKFPYAMSREFFLNFYGSEQKCTQAVEDWVRFKAGETNLEGEILE